MKKIDWNEKKTKNDTNIQTGIDVKNWTKIESKYDIDRLNQVETKKIPKYCHFLLNYDNILVRITINLKTKYVKQKSEKEIQQKLWLKLKQKLRQKMRQHLS